VEADAREVIGSLARQVADLTVRLAVAEAQVAAFERAEVDRIAAEEAADEDG
jgi:hypothetical protein